MNNRTLLVKADLALNDLTVGGGVLSEQPAKQFLRLLVQQSEAMKLFTVRPMKGPRERIPRIGITNRVLRPATEKTPLDDPAHRATVDNSFVELDAQKFIGEVQIPNEVLEDSIEQGRLQQTIMALTSEAVARDIEEMVIVGDTGLGAPAHPNLAAIDGVLKQAVSHPVDAAGGRISFDLLSAMMRQMPKPYRRLKGQMLYMTSDNAEDDYRKLLQNRETAEGDNRVEGESVVKYHGREVRPISLWPEEQGGGSDETSILLTFPKNVVVGIWRQVRMRLDENIRGDYISIVVTTRFDVKYAVEDAVVRAHSVLNS